MLINMPKLLVESSFCMLVFYGFYYLLLRRETFFQVNRFYLLLTPFLALVIPQLNISLPSNQPDQALEIVYPALIAGEELEQFFWPTTVTSEYVSAISLGELCFYLYLIGALIMLSRLLLNLWQLSQIIFRGKRQQLPQAIVVESQNQIPTASFFNYIFWKGDRQHTEEQLIWNHEMVHIKQRHSLDLLLMEVMVVLNWFNPLIYLFRNSLKLTHEYIADQEVVRLTKAKVAYAKLLVSKTMNQPNSRLLNTFHSLTKMRLIMLGKTNSKPWKGLKYFLSLPLLMGLSLLFSFDLVDALPDQVSQPLTEAESYLDNLKEKPLTLKVKPNSTYEIQWGDNSCDCFNDQFPNFYQCAQLTIPLKAFKRLAKKSEGFTLLKNGTPIDFQELEVMSKRMLPLDGYEGQFDLQNTFDNNSIFWDKIEKGDVLKFTFKANEKQVFTFDVTVNTRKNALDYAYHFCFEDEQFPVDMTNGQSIRTVDMLDFAKIINQPLTIKKNNKEPLIIENFILSNQKAMRSHQVKNPGSTINLSDFPAVNEAEPGDRITLRVLTTEGKKLELAFDIRKNSSWNGERRKLELVWGKGVYAVNNRPIYIEAEKIKALAGEPMSFRLNGEALNINSIALLNRPHSSTDKDNYVEPCVVEDYQHSFACIEQLLKNSGEDDMFYFNDIQTDSQHKIFLFITSEKVDRTYTILRDTVPQKEKLEKEKLKEEKVEQKQIQKQEKVEQKQVIKEDKVKIQKGEQKIKADKVKIEKDKVKIQKADKVKIEKDKVKIQKADKAKQKEKIKEE